MVRGFSIMSQIAIVAYLAKQFNDVGNQHAQLLDRDADMMMEILESNKKNISEYLPANIFVYASEDEDFRTYDMSSETNMSKKFVSERKDFESIQFLSLSHYDRGECITPGIKRYIDEFPELKTG